MEHESWPSYQWADNREANLKAAVADLENQLNQLITVSQAMWELLKRETQLTEADLQEKVKALQAQKERRSPLCPYCHRAIQISTGKCLYCNKTVERALFDDLYFR